MLHNIRAMRTVLMFVVVVALFSVLAELSSVVAIEVNGYRCENDIELEGHFLDQDVHLGFAFQHDASKMNQLKEAFYAVNTPGSEQVGRYLSRADMATLFEPTQFEEKDFMESFQEWLRTEMGAKDVKVGPFGNHVDVILSLQAVERMLGLRARKWISSHQGDDAVISLYHTAEERSHQSMLEFVDIPAKFKRGLRHIYGIVDLPMKNLAKLAVQDSIGSVLGSSDRAPKVLQNTLQISPSVTMLVPMTCPGGNESIPILDGKDFVCKDGKEKLKLAVLEVTNSRADGSQKHKVAINAQVTKLQITLDAMLVYTVVMELYVPHKFSFGFTWTGGSGKVVYDFPGTVSAVEAKTPENVKAYYSIPPSYDGHVENTPAEVSMSIVSLDLDPSENGHFDSAAMDEFMKEDGYSETFVTVENKEQDKSKTAGVEVMLDAEWMGGIARNIPLIIYFEKQGQLGGSLQEVLSEIMAMDDENRPTVLSISYGTEEVEADRDTYDALNEQFQALGAMGVTVVVAAGDRGSFGFARAGDHCPSHMSALFPGSSPFVTSVGATRLVAESVGQCPRETVASSDIGGSITSGGGFSALFDAEDYQRRAVTRYFNSSLCSFPKSNSFDGRKRAFPDISVMGNTFPVSLGAGDVALVDGTSASAPVFAAFIALINNGRVKEGNFRLGFINLWLYEALEQDAKNFQDITQGSTRCVARGVCCDLGFEACPGFDAASGLGSPDMVYLGVILMGAAQGFPGGKPDNLIFGCGNRSLFSRLPWWWWLTAGIILGSILIIVRYFKQMERSQGENVDLENSSEYLDVPVEDSLEYQPPEIPTAGSIN